MRKIVQVIQKNYWDLEICRKCDFLIIYLFLHFFTDWFPGWTRNYGAEPSSQTPSEDCVALRQSFPGLGPDAVALTSVEAKDVRGDNFSLYV